jgi:hypothetical protein
MQATLTTKISYSIDWNNKKTQFYTCQRVSDMAGENYSINILSNKITVLYFPVAVGGKRMAALLGYFAKFRCTMRGWPDLFLYKPNEQSILLAEVKGL